MSIRILAYVFAGILSIGLVGCGDRDAGDAVEDAMESTAEGVEELGDETEDAVD